jgi:hypothetical protein
VTQRPRLLIASDLHLEFYQDRGRSLLRGLAWDREASAVILAGDVGVAGKRRATLEVAFEFFSEQFPAIFYVPATTSSTGTERRRRPTSYGSSWLTTRRSRSSSPA